MTLTNVIPLSKNHFCNGIKQLISVNQIKELIRDGYKPLLYRKEDGKLLGYIFDSINQSNGYFKVCYTEGGYDYYPPEEIKSMFRL